MAVASPAVRPAARHRFDDGHAEFDLAVFHRHAAVFRRAAGVGRRQKPGAGAVCRQHLAERAGARDYQPAGFAAIGIDGGKGRRPSAQLDVGRFHHGDFRHRAGVPEFGGLAGGFVFLPGSVLAGVDVSGDEAERGKEFREK